MDVERLTHVELRDAVRAASDGKTDATALLQEWHDRYGSFWLASPPPGTYSISDFIAVGRRR